MCLPAYKWFKCAKQWFYANSYLGYTVYMHAFVYITYTYFNVLNNGLLQSLSWRYSIYIYNELTLHVLFLFNINYAN